MSSFTPPTDITAQLRSDRIAQGVEHSALANDTEKLEVVKRWQSEVIKVRLKQRKKEWRKVREEEKEGWILRSEHGTGGSGGIVGRRYTGEGPSTRTYSAPAVLVGEVGECAEGPQSPTEPPAYEDLGEYPAEKEDTEVQSTLELEQSIAEVERRGHERGLEEARVVRKGKQKVSVQ